MTTEHPSLPEPGSTPVAPPRQTTAYLKELFSQVGFTIDARRGQNFLVDLNLLDLLARSAEVAPDDVVLEVGTGTGALTERLSRAARSSRSSRFRSTRKFCPRFASIEKPTCPKSSLR